MKTFHVKADIKKGEKLFGTFGAVLGSQNAGMSINANSKEDAIKHVQKKIKERSRGPEPYQPELVAIEESYKVHYPSLKKMTQLQYTDPRVNTEGKTIHVTKEGNFRKGDSNCQGTYIVYEDAGMPGSYIGVHIGNDINEESGEAPVSVVAIDTNRAAVVNRVAYRMRKSVQEGTTMTESENQKMVRLSGLLTEGSDTTKLPVKAKDNHGHSYDVVINHDGFRGDKKPVLKIVGTPGSWYMYTLKNHHGNTISIDYGQNWDCINFNEIYKAAMKQLGEGVERLTEHVSDDAVERIARKYKMEQSNPHHASFSSDFKDEHHTMDLVDKLKRELKTNGWDLVHSDGTKGSAGWAKFHEFKQTIGGVKASATVSYGQTTSNGKKDGEYWFVTIYSR